jgi:hypothetical protein
MSRDFASIPPSRPEPERAALGRLARRSARIQAALFSQLVRDQASARKKFGEPRRQPPGEER